MLWIGDNYRSAQRTATMEARAISATIPSTEITTLSFGGQLRLVHRFAPDFPQRSPHRDRRHFSRCSKSVTWSYICLRSLINFWILSTAWITVV